MKKIGFIGTGVMGASMVKNLLKHGFSVNVYNRSPKKAQDLVQYGAVFCETIKCCVHDTDVNIMIVGMPSDVESVAREIFKNAIKPSILIDMTTSSPSLAKVLFDKGQHLSIEVLDAPVSGGDLGALNGTLSIMVGGLEATFKKVTPIFEAIGKTIIYCGKEGSGQHTKMANQIAIAGTIAGVSEALAYAKVMGLDLNTLMSAIGAGAAGSWQLTNNGAKMIQEDYTPGFFIKHFVKDMDIAYQGAYHADLDLPVLETVLKRYQAMLLEDGDLGTQALIKEYLKKKVN